MLCIGRKRPSDSGSACALSQAYKRNSASGRHRGYHRRDT
jgi:hypothetical protein